MSLGPIEAQVQLTIAGVPSDQFAARYERAVIEALQFAEQWLEGLKADIPKATESLRSSFNITMSLYGATKTITFAITAAHAPYVLQFGRGTGKRPPWHAVRTWAIAKGVNLRQARAWWWKHGGDPKVYRSPKGSSLRLWWTTQLNNFKYILERELRVRLQAAGFDRNEVQVTFQ